MRFLAFSLLLALAACGSGPAEHPLAGRWTGAVVYRGSELPSVLDLRVEDGALAGAIRNTLMLREGRLQSLRWDPPRLHFETGDGDTLAVFDGRLAGDSLVGTVRRGGELEARAVFRRVGPVPPPAFFERPARFRSGDVVLAGTLLVPAAPGPHPAVVFVHGSGPGPRETLRALADTFARAGVAALIYDKRGSGASTGDQARSPFPALAGDVSAAVEWVRRQPGIDSARVALWGGSEGAVVAPLAAASNPHVRALVLVASPGTTFGRQDLDRIAAQMRRRGFAEDEIRAAGDNRRRAHALVRAGGATPQAVGALRAEARGQRWERDFGVPPAGDPWWTWYRTKIDHDPLPVLRRLRLPTLVLMGAEDDVVPPEPNVPLLRGALTGNPEARLLVLAGADHNLQLAGGPLPDGGFRWPSLAPGATDSMIAFARRHLLPSPTRFP